MVARVAPLDAPIHKWMGILFGMLMLVVGRGGAYGDRTRYLLLAKQALYQVS